MGQLRGGGEVARVAQRINQRITVTGGVRGLVLANFLDEAGGFLGFGGSADADAARGERLQGG